MVSTVFAYNGSTHGDWVGTYAVRLAAAAPDSALRVVHVEEHGEDAERFAAKLARLEESAAAAGVALEVRRVAAGSGEVAAVLEEAIPDDPAGIVVTGLRARETGRGLLRGTISERLMSSARHSVLALRVVSPGLLGQVEHLLFALSQNPRSAARAALFLRRFAPGLRRLSLLTVMEPPRAQTAAEVNTLHALGREHLRRSQAELRTVYAPRAFPVDPHVAISKDWASEIVRQAARVKAQLLLIGATERSLPSRLVFGNPLERVLEDAPCDVAIFHRKGAP